MVLLASCCPSSVREISLGCDILRIFTSAPNWKREKHQRNHQPKNQVKWNSPQGLPGKSLGGTPFLNQKRWILLYLKPGGRGCKATLELPVQPWSQSFYCSKSDPQIYLQMWSFSAWMGHQKIGIWCPPVFLCTTSAKCFIGFRQQLQIHQNFSDDVIICPLALPGSPPPKKSTSSEAVECHPPLRLWMAEASPSLPERKFHRFPKCGRENSPSPEKKCAKRDWTGFTFSWIPNPCMTFMIFLMHFYWFILRFGMEKTWGIVCRKIFFGVIASAKKISQDLPGSPGVDLSTP